MGDDLLLNRAESRVRYEVILPATAQAAPLARSALDEAILPHGLHARIDDARLVITELVTNAVRHGELRSGDDVIRLVIETDDDALYVEVKQPTPAIGVRPIEPRLDDPTSVGGFGLRLVDVTADQWGVEPGPPGHVWFQIRTDGSVSAK
jgi:anti-sigma regulatory factor (Ser/Thr protein kinase)